MYDTVDSSYAGLKDLRKMIRNQEDIQVIENDSKEDITVATLIKVILLSEDKTNYSIPVEVLHSIIRERDGSFSAFLGKKLGFSTEQMTRNSKKKPNSSEKEENQDEKISSLIASHENVREDEIPNLPGKGLE